MSAAAIQVSQVSHHYGTRCALDAVSLSITGGEIFGFLGPNGGGKTTLFRLLSTLIPIQQGEIWLQGYNVTRQAAAVRREIGVVFQAPSLDKKLTVAENLRHQGHLYGLSGQRLAQREDEMLARLGLTERRHDRAETLSGGLRRRVELAKGLLHRPRILLLDEPSTGLDPGARSDLWDYLHLLRSEDGVTIVLTTHLLEEAERADRLAILDRGRLVALDTPEQLRSEVGGDTITIETDEPQALAARLRERLELEPTLVDGTVRLQLVEGHRWIARLVEAAGQGIRSITLGKPTLEDVFVARTGHRFWGTRELEENSAAGRSAKEVPVGR